MFKKYLAEAAKQYDFVIKVCGDVMAEDTADKLEMALKKWDVSNFSAGKKTPIQNVPLDFPHKNNCEVTIYETTLNYPVTTHELNQYLSSLLNISPSDIVIRVPGEPYEEYQAEKENKPYESKLMDGQYKDGEAVNKDELVATEKGKETFLQSLAKEQKEREAGE